jgi:LuxR family maltose regulon positive regulatory protein
MEFWSGHADAAAAAFNAGAAAASAPGSARERADCLGQLALLEALRGRLDHAAGLATDVVGPAADNKDATSEPVSSAAEVALACVHTERNELPAARARLKRADEALHARPARLISATAGLVAARRSLAEGRPGATLEIAGRVRQGWSPPSWLDRRLRLLESSASAAMSDTDSAVAAATSAGSGCCLDAAAALAHAWLAAGDPQAASQALASVPAGAETPDSARLEGLLADARVGYDSGDTGRGRRCLEQALRLAEPERLRLPFALQRKWIQPVLRRDPALAATYRHLLEPDLVRPAAVRSQLPDGAGQAAPLIVERLSGREREVLKHVAAMLSTAEIAAEMYISVNTVKTHLKSIYRKLSATHRGEAVRRARQLELL